MAEEKLNKHRRATLMTPSHTRITVPGFENLLFNIMGKPRGSFQVLLSLKNSRGRGRGWEQRQDLGPARAHLPGRGLRAPAKQAGAGAVQQWPVSPWRPWPWGNKAMAMPGTGAVTSTGDARRRCIQSLSGDGATERKKGVGWEKPNKNHSQGINAMQLQALARNSSGQST